VPTRIDAELREFRDWTFRFRPAASQPARLLVLIHGWTGDENSMWVFAHQLPPQEAVLAPRAPYSAPEGGYTWREIIPGTWGLPGIDDLRPSAEALIGFIDDFSASVGMTVRQIDLVGFSQGAALSYTLAILHPERIRVLAALSGFLPQGADGLLASRSLAGKPFFVAHGRQDNMIPVEQARKAVKLLESSGAKVTYCESDGGHKVSAECFTGLAELFE
jgi:phospholipase/carboxylesterase